MTGTESTSLVDRAEKALRQFGDLDYAEASRLLPTWFLHDKLTVRERAEVLRRFTHVDRVTKCAECGELVEHYRGEPDDLLHHLGWPKAVQK